jgi:micrococcal nuclease
MTNCSHALLLLLLALPAIAQTFTAKVVSITDGDTISVLRNDRAQRVRLNGIDCPESRQPFGTKAKQFTADLAFGTVVTIRTVDVDRYGRIVADVILANGRNLNHELVKAGMAWWYRRYTARLRFSRHSSWQRGGLAEACGWIPMRSHLGSGGRACVQLEMLNE